MKYLAPKLFFIILFSIIFNVTVFAKDFDDVKKDHWAYEQVVKLRELGITNGLGNNKFGLGKSLTRAEFVTFLSNLMNWKTDNINTFSFEDNKDTTTWYYKYIEAGVLSGAIKKDTANFNPNSPITREDMAVMIVRALGYDDMAQQINYPASFVDVTSNNSYITIAKDFGIISGVTASSFAPKNTATREQAAAMLIRMYDSLESKIKNLNGFYAISSYSQVNFIDDLDSVAFGWTRLETDGTNVKLNYTVSNENDYYLPEGHNIPFERASNKLRLLMIAVKDSDSSNIINNDNLRNSSVDIISGSLNEKLDFDGVVIDFETLKGTQSKNNFNDFLIRLKEKIGNKKLYVAVHPKRPQGHDYYDGYDYKTIGFIADKIILMAHDYNAKILTSAEMEQGIVMTPLAPINEIYHALKSISEDVLDKNKIMLQISFSSAQWVTQDGKVINNKPYTPTLDSIIKRINSGATLSYSQKYKSPYITFTDKGQNNIIWYENNKSVYEKIKLAKLFKIDNISIWRLGTIPNGNQDIGLDIWDIIKNSEI